MPTSTTGKIKLSGFDQRSGKPATASTPPAQPRTHGSQPAAPGRAASPSNSTANSKSASTATETTKTGNQSASLLPGGPWLWCLMGLAIGLSVWLGGRSYLRATLATQLAEAETEQAALQSIDALLRLDADASIEVSRSLAHPEFMVANAAFRALGGQLDAWAKLEPDERLRRMQQVITELDRIPPDIDQDHRILITGLTSRIYADALSNREEGAALLLDGCRRILARAEPNLAATRIARLEQIAPGPNVLRRDQSDTFSDE
ncbi:MAG: hypothetical protein IT423_15825, partial [Pirellulaceae bacterium]|nr:hypothetical protein [Pirellulaceae bacterium]